ncbi:hypothetical protein PT2222_50232 [Paraburkholderia tropica]
MRGRRPGPDQVRPAWRRLVAVAAEDAEDCEQVREHVVQVQVDRERGRDVVGLAAVHDALHVEQHVRREDHDGQHGHGEHQRGQVQEDVRDAGEQDHDHAHEQPLAEARKITLADRGDRGHGRENHAGATKSEHDERRAVRETEDERQQAREHQAHEEREAEQDEDAGRAVLGAFDSEHEAESDGEERQQTHGRAGSREKRETRGHAHPRTDDGRHHREREQPVGVAQYAVAGLGAGDAATTAEVVGLVHAFSLRETRGSRN